MARRVAVSDSLSPLKQMLHRAGYDVVNLENEAVLSETGMSEYDAVVVSGVDVNLMGMQDISGRSVVINATGKSPLEILEELRSRLLSFYMRKVSLLIQGGSPGSYILLPYLI